MLALSGPDKETSGTANDGSISWKYHQTQWVVQWECMLVWCPQGELTSFMWKLKVTTKHWLPLCYFPLPSLKSSVLHTLSPCWEEVNPRLIPLIPGVGQSQTRDVSTENLNEQKVEKDMLLAEQEWPSFCEVLTAVKSKACGGGFFKQFLQKTVCRPASYIALPFTSSAAL